MLSIFSCVCRPFVCLPWRNVYLGLPLFSDWVACFFFYIELHELFVYFGDESLVSCFICKCFLPYWCRLSCLWFPLLYKGFFSLIRSHLFIFVFIFITLDSGSRRPCGNLSQRLFCLCFPDLNGKEIQKKGGYMYTYGWCTLLYSRK